MSGLTITNLPWPEDRYRVDLHSPGFESTEAAVAEDSFRAKRLRKLAKSRKAKKAAGFKRLADLLDPEVTPATPQTLASSRYMRELRIRVIGAVWKLAVEDQTEQVERIDVLKPGWAMPMKGLSALEPARLRAEFRADLLRAAKKLDLAGTANCKGFLIGFLHGERQADSGQLHPHYHILVSGDWIKVVMTLKKQRKYKATGRVTRPIRRRKRLSNLAYALTYLLKAYWPEKWKGHVSGVDRDRRNHGHRRIKEPQHSKLLLWFHQCNLENMVLKMGMRQDRLGFKLTDPYK